MLCGCLVGGIGHGVVYLLFYISFFFFLALRGMERVNLWSSHLSHAYSKYFFICHMLIASIFYGFASGQLSKANNQYKHETWLYWLWKLWNEHIMRNAVIFYENCGLEWTPYRSRMRLVQRTKHHLSYLVTPLNFIYRVSLPFIPFFYMSNRIKLISGENSYI